ncbi:MAG: hypothetical protein AAGM22_28360 [Acidobacteriota bacterium]
MLNLRLKTFIPSALLVMLAGAGAAAGTPCSGNCQAEVISVDFPRVMAAGESYEVSVTVKNTGTPWGANPNIYLGYLREGGAWPTGLWSDARIDPPVPTCENPTSPEGCVLYTFRWQVDAPSLDELPAPIDQERFFLFRWRMIEQGGDGWFGESTQALGDTEYVEVTDLDEHVRVVGGDLMEGSRPFVIAGVTINGFNEAAPPECDPFRGDEQKIWCTYDPDPAAPAGPGTSKADLMVDFDTAQAMGANTVRMSLPGEIFETDDPAFNDGICAKVVDVMEELKKRGMRAIFHLPDATRYRALFTDHFCEGQSITECDASDSPWAKAAIVRPEVAAFQAQRWQHLIGACLVPEASHLSSVVVGYRGWDEAQTSFFEFSEQNDGEVVAVTGDRQLPSIVKEWNDYLTQRYDPAGGVPSVALANARAAWGFSDPTAGPAVNECMMPSGVAGMCPPKDGAFCTNRAGAYANLAKEYRIFADTRTRDSFQLLVDAVRNAEDASVADPWESHAVSFAVSSLLAWPAANAQDQCEKVAGYRMDPRTVSEPFDMVSINFYPWRSRTDLPSDAPLSEEFIKMRLMIDYARGDDSRPIVLQETGGPSCDEVQNPPAGVTGVCNGVTQEAYDATQVEVNRLAAEAAADRSVDGALIFALKPRPNNRRWGLYRLDGTPRAAAAETDEHLAIIKRSPDASYSPPTLSSTIDADYCSNVLLDYTLLPCDPTVDLTCTSPAPASVFDQYLLDYVGSSVEIDVDYTSSAPCIGSAFASNPNP